MYIKRTGFEPHRDRPGADEQEAATRFHTFWPLTLCQTTQSGEVEKKP